MTITAQTSKTGPYSGNGTTIVFSYTFEVQDEAHLVVTVLGTDGSTESVKVLNTDYTVTGVGNASGGAIVMGTAPAAGEQLVITRDIPLTQEIDLQNRGGVNPETLEQGFDKLTQIAQDLQEQYGRTLKVDAFDGGTFAAVLPPKADRAGNYFAFDTNGDPVMTSGTTNASIVSAFAETLLDDVDAATMLTTLGLSATAAELNQLDGVTWTLTDYNALTATATELNLLDGVTGKTGADNVLVTGTAGFNGQLAQWNSNGDVVGYTLHTQSTEMWRAGTSTVDGIVSPAKVAAAIAAQVAPVWTESAVVATTGGTTFDFTSLPAGITEMQLFFDEVSLSGSDHFAVLLSTGSVFQVTGYRATAAAVDASANFLYGTTLLPLYGQYASGLFSGVMSIYRLSGNVWTMTAIAGGAAPLPRVSGGRVAMSGEVDGLRLSRTGSNTFDNGQIKLRYR